MSLWDHLRTGWLEIRAHKLRSFLSFLAIAIGVASILYTFGKIHGTRRWVSEALLLMGPGRMEVEKKRNFVSKGLSPGLTLDDAIAIRAAMPELYMVDARHSSWGIRFRLGEDHGDRVMAVGVTEQWRRRDWVYRLRGRFLDADDVRQGRRVCVLVQPGGWVKKPFWARWFQEGQLEKLLKRRDLLGETIMLGEHLFTVVGVVKEPPRDKDPRWRRNWRPGDVALLPITTYQRTLARFSSDENNRQIEEIQIDTGDERTIGLVKKKIEILLAARHRGEEDVEVTDNRQMIQEVLNNTRKFIIAVLTIGVVAILAGGIGIMNVTLATIFSRVKEIGVRRALGATRGDILLQFVTEATVLGFLGGVAGIALGAAIVSLLADADDKGLGDVLAWHYAASLLISIGAGFLFALYPASQAARLDPVEALHYE